MYIEKGNLLYERIETKEGYTEKLRGNVFSVSLIPNKKEVVSDGNDSVDIAIKLINYKGDSISRNETVICEIGGEMIEKEMVDGESVVSLTSTRKGVIKLNVFIEGLAFGGIEIESI